MKGRVAILLGPLLALGAEGSVTAQRPIQAPAGAGNQLAARLLHEHNRERDRAGVPRLAWSNRLAHDALVWARSLASRGWLRHASHAQSGGAGENLWMGSAGHFQPEAMIGHFLAERRHFRHGRFPDVSRTGNWRDVGHYTQVVWRETREVGCAIARSARHDVLVCRYWPAGNWMGEIPY